MFESVSIRVKLIAAIIAAGLFSILTLSLGSYYLTRHYFLQAAFESFTAIREIKKQQIESYFQQIRNQCHTFAQDTMIINAMKEFKQTFYTVNEGMKYNQATIAAFTDGLKNYYKNEFLARLNPNVDVKHTVEEYFKNISVETIILQHFYIVANPNPTGKKDNLNRADDGSAYSRWHGKYHPIIREFLKKFGYYDIFLIDIENGTIVYTVFKEVDYTTSLMTGPFKNSNFAKVFSAAQEVKNKDEVKIVDFAYYDPSYGAPAAFIAAPIFDGDKKIGVLALQFPIDKINQIMTNDKKWQETGLGRSGEMYLIGQDHKMRTVSRFLEEDPKAFFTALEESGVSKQIIDKIRLLKTTILIQDINTKAAQEVMAGNAGTIVSTNYRSIPVVSSFAPLAIEGLKWGIIAEIDESEVIAPVKKVAWVSLGVGLLLLFILIIFSILIARVLLRPLQKIKATVEHVIHKKGINLQETLIVESNDEIGDIAAIINTFIEEIRKQMNAIALIKKELRTITHKITDLVDPLYNETTQKERLISQAIEKVAISHHQALGIATTMTDYQRYIQDITKVAEQIAFLLLARTQTNSSIGRTVYDMQQEDQKLLVLLEKEIFDIRQAMHYLDEGHIASVKEVAKTLLIDTENATNITRLLATALHQTTLLIDEDRRGYEKMNNALDMLKKEIETVVKQVADTKINMQREEKGIRNYQEQLEKIYKDTQESAELVHAIIEAIKKLDHHVSMLDDSLKRFSW